MMAAALALLFCRADSRDSSFLLPFALRKKTAGAPDTFVYILPGMGPADGAVCHPASEPGDWECP